MELHRESSESGAGDLGKMSSSNTHHSTRTTDVFIKAAERSKGLTQFGLRYEDAADGYLRCFYLGRPFSLPRPLREILGEKLFGLVTI